MFCRNCGAENADGVRFCVKCGSPLTPNENDNPVQQPVTPPQPEYQQPFNQQMASPQQQPVNQQPFNQQMAPPPSYQQPVTPPPMYQPPVNTAPVKKGLPTGAIVGIVIAALVVVLLLGFGILGYLGEKNDVAGDSATLASDTSTDTDNTVADELVETSDMSARTVMLYMIGSTLEYDSETDNLLGLAADDIEEMLKATYSDDINIIIQTGGSLKWDNSDIRGDVIKDETTQRFKIEKEGLKELDNLGRVSMVEESTLSEFIKFAHNNYPAKENILILWDHGGGVPNGFGSDVLFPDDTLDDVEIGNALKMAGVHFDTVIFNACLMCSLEVYKSIESYADYAVAAESVVTGFVTNGSGLNYTNFINQLNDVDRPLLDCCDILLEDYIKCLSDRNYTGTMSVVRLDRIDDVYNAYANYIKACNDDLINGKFVDIVQARNNCGDFDGYDFVDLSTLATAYPNDYSTDLQNAVSNALEKTKSLGYSNGRGITAYYPYDLCLGYDLGRKSLVTLNYDSAILDFYDRLASREFDILGENGTSFSWYVADNNFEYDNRQASSEPQVLPTVEKNGYKVVELTADDWDIIISSSIRQRVFYADEDGYFSMLGTDNNWFYLDTDLVMEKPTTWFQVNNKFPTAYVLNSTTNDDDSVFEVIGFEIGVNGQPAAMIATMVDYSDPEIVGYYLCDDDFNIYDDDDLHEFTGDEEIQLVVEAYDFDTDETIFRSYNERHAARDLVVTYDKVDFTAHDFSDFYVKYTLDDVYGNSYETKLELVD